ncbi:uncharacterized protein [Eleutherodactylus coqui]|uniref:uncharacterized protein n=1 Tax=Eleutherodactylus coqui TaxID=57060 RepID=UPI003462B299
MSRFGLCLCVFIQASWTFPMYAMKTHGYSADNLIKKQRSDSQHRERMENILEMFGADRWSKGQDILKHHRSQCNYMNQFWTQWQGSTDNQDASSVFMLKVFTGPLKPVFPQKNLFQYMSRIYRCCRLGFGCRRIKGLQGTLDEGGRVAAFYIDSDVFSSSIQRAELHLEVSAGEELTVIPELFINGLRRSSFTQIRRGPIMDLSLDVMFLLQVLKEKALADPVNEEVTELSLSLHCIQNDLQVPCNLPGAPLLQPPFIALQYRY